MLFGGVVDEDVQTAECLDRALDRVPAKRLIAHRNLRAQCVQFRAAE